jgi:hypothetical protein
MHTGLSWWETSTYVLQLWTGKSFASAACSNLTHVRQCMPAARPDSRNGKADGQQAVWWHRPNQAAACDAQPLLCTCLYHCKMLIRQILTSLAMHASSTSCLDAAKRECWRADARCNTACLAVCSGYQEEAITSWGNDTTDSVMEALGAIEQDICWATPVLDEHFTYFSSVLAGKDDSHRFLLQSGRLILCHALCAAIMPLSYAAAFCICCCNSCLLS